MVKPQLIGIKPSGTIAIGDDTKLRLRQHKVHPRESDDDCLTRVLNQLESIEPSTINKELPAAL